MPETPVTDRLLRFESACEQIWPAICFFGLCGANPQYIVAMTEIGDLIGKFPQNNPVDAPALILASKCEAREQIADIVASHPDFKAKIGRGLAAEFAALIRKLQISDE